MKEIAILVIDMPDEAKAEDYYMVHSLFEHKTARVGEVVFECENVDLKPLPKKMKVDDTFMLDYQAMEKGYQCGWNACLDEILGENNG